jgi:hypothetical protein
LIVPENPEHLAVKGWLVRVKGTGLLGGSNGGGIPYHATATGVDVIGELLNTPAAVNCAWPPWAATLAGLTVIDCSRLLLPHPKIPEITKERMIAEKKELRRICMTTSNQARWPGAGSGTSSPSTSRL